MAIGGKNGNQGLLGSGQKKLSALVVAGSLALGCGRTPLEPTPDDCFLSAPNPVKALAGRTERTRDSWDSEVAAVVDKVSPERWAYVAVVESITNTSPASVCQLERLVHVYRSQNGGDWTDVVSA